MSRFRALVLIVSAALSSCSEEPSSSLDGGADAPSPDAAALETDAGPALEIGATRFFGFVAIDCGYDDPLDVEVRTDYVDEVSGFTNVAHVCTNDARDDLTARLSRLEAAGLRAFVTIEPVLFVSVEGTSPGDPAHRLALRSDAAARLAQWVEINASVLDDAHVAALYVCDEPAWNGLPMTELATAAALLDAATDLPLFFVEAGAALDGLVIPEQIDLVGFDRYDTRDPATDTVWLGDLATLSALRSRAEQRIVLVMDTQWRDYYGEAGVTPADMAGVARSTIAVAARTPEVVGIVGYLWPGGLDMPTQLGARELPGTVLDVYRELGRVVRTAAP